MTDAILAREVYLVKEYCDALLAPQMPNSDPLQLMRNMCTAAQKVAGSASENPAIVAINHKVTAVYEDFRAEEYRITSSVKQRLAEIATDVLAEAGRLYPEIYAQ